MADSFLKKKKTEEWIRKRDEVFSRFDTERGISRNLNVQLAYLGIIGFVCNLITWIVWIRDSFPSDTAGSFCWYVLNPFLVQEVIVLVGHLARKLLNNPKRKKREIDVLINSIVGSLIYTSFFMVLIYYYREMPVFWLFAVCPMLLSSFYRDNTWFLVTLISTSVEVIIVIMGFFEVPTYRLESIPPRMMATEAVVIASLVGAFTVALHSRIEQVIRNVAKAEATQQAKSAFFDHMSSQLKSPINSVLGLDELILREDIKPEVEKYAIGIRGAGESLLAIVNDILDNSKLEKSQVELAPVDFDLMSLLVECYNMAILRTSEKELALRVVNDPTVPRLLCGDEIRIRQIIMNLLSNAIKFTNVGYVEINVGWKPREERKIDLIIAIEDTGVGIAEADKQKLFRAFERFDESTNRYVQGSGLGLSITKKLLELMGGNITVESTMHEGSTFKIRIPVEKRSDMEMGDFNQAISLRVCEPTRRKEKALSPSVKILVVDDVPLNIEVFEGFLTKKHVNIMSALSGKEALSLAERERFDLIFIDYLMPEMDGEETLNNIRGTYNKNTQTPIIAISADDSPDTEAKFKEMGFNDFLAKPIKGKTLEDMMCKYLSCPEKSKEKEKEAPSDNQTVENLVGFVDRIDFLDTGVGMSACGNDEKQYRNNAVNYLNNSSMAKLIEVFEENDWAQYKGIIASIKKDSLSIGAVDLSNKAGEIEECIGKKDFDGVRILHQNLIRDYEIILTKLKEILI